ncbi:preprotein translocase subunit SecE [Bifidobacterium callitrichos]|nr:preprotein translocase subunit SecE [Bifidobacterium callitrichos]
MNTPNTTTVRHNPFSRIGLYIRQTIEETRKTVTPTAREWAGWSLAAFLFVLTLMTLVTGTDFGLGKLTLFIFG